MCTNRLQCSFCLFFISLAMIFLLFVNCSRSDVSTAVGDSSDIEETEEGSYLESGVIDNNGDTDKDGLKDTIESEIGTDPNLADTDFDGLSDGDEYYDGLDSTDPLIFNGLTGYTYKSTIADNMCQIYESISAGDVEGDSARLKVQEGPACISSPDAFHFSGEADWMPNAIEGFSKGFDDDNIVVHYKGLLYVPGPAKVRFSLADTDDDAFLYINGDWIIADFKYPTTEPVCAYHPSTPTGTDQTVSLPANKDWHEIEIIYWERYRKVNLDLRMQIVEGEGSGGSLEFLSPEILRGTEECNDSF